ncbi:MAG TPA: peptidylprolyl isomerase [Tepidisphaeraceae bacterium]|nr:peptidylprolyl isomerase [Tepidisphaeraceae bacterium]
MRNRLVIIALLVVGAVYIMIASNPPAGQVTADSGAAEAISDGGQPETMADGDVSKEKKQYDKPPEMKIDPNKSYTATIDTTQGKIVLELFAKDAPKTVNNFVFLARDKFYDGIVFHRVIPNFMVQGGDPTGTGSGGPGYTFEDEVRDNPRKHQVGSLSMANSGPNTNGSQFFITHVKTDWLDGKHTVFGQVKEGQDVVNKIQKGDKIKTVTIEEK